MKGKKRHSFLYGLLRGGVVHSPVIGLSMPTPTKEEICKKQG